MAKKPKKVKIWSPNGYIFAALRRIFRWSPERRKALKEAQLGEEYTCASCSKQYPKQDIAVDHKEPVVSPQTGFQGWDIYVQRLFCLTSELQVLCKQCHSAKSKTENAERRARKALGL